jgi:hypothetical protein
MCNSEREKYSNGGGFLSFIHRSQLSSEQKQLTHDAATERDEDVVSEDYSFLI